MIEQETTNNVKYTILKAEELMLLSLEENSKIPATWNGLKDAKKNYPIEIKSRFDVNIGLYHKGSGTIALDLDYHNEDSNADENLKKLEEELGKLPETLTVKTATGNGRHLIYTDDGIVNPKGRLCDDIDIRHNAYTVFPPSKINGNQYTFLSGEVEKYVYKIASLPPKWVDYINKPVYSKQKKNINFEKANKSIAKPKIVYSTKNIENMFNNCAFLAACRDCAAELSEPAWFSMISILTQIEGTDELIHELSKPYPNYSYEETQKKIENAKKFGRSHSCAYISSEFPEICDNCKFFRMEK